VIYNSIEQYIFCFSFKYLIGWSDNQSVTHNNQIMESVSNCW